MKYLTDQYWFKFKKDGKLFEEMCGKLLEKLLKTKISQTKLTRDHARDYEGKIPFIDHNYMIIWGECKYHARKLSLQMVSSTLVMAYLNDIDLLFFFSYSPVTKEFDQHITDFCDKAKIRHWVYDDCRLEALLLECQNEPWFHDYFSYENQMEYSFQWGIEIRSCLKKSSSNENSKIADREYNVNESFEYRIYIQNNDIHNDASVKMELQKDDALRYFEIVSEPSPSKYTKKITVPRCSTRLIVYKLRIIKYKPEVCTPLIKIYYDDQCEEIHERIKMNWLAEVSLLGSRYSDFLVKLKKNYRNLNTGSIIHIYGKSGSGKSRMINEMINIYDRSCYKILHFDVEKQYVDTQSIIKIIVSQLEHLPLYMEHPVNYKTNSQAANQRIKFDILYNTEYDISSHITEVLNYIYSLFNKYKVLLVIDNLQKCENDTLEFFRNFILRMLSSESKTVIIVSFNTDYLFNHNLARKTNDLLLLRAAKYPENYVSFECNGFDQVSAEIYLRQCVQPQLSDETYMYHKTFQMIIDTVGSNPFILQQLMIYLAQKEVISLSEKGTFYFRNIEKFHKTIKRLPPTVQGMLRLRESFFLDSLTLEERQLYEQTISVLLFFQSVPLNLYYKIFTDYGILDRLQSAGFIKIQSNDEITFYHNNFAVYYKENTQLANKYKEMTEHLILSIEAVKMNEVLFPAYFILKHKLEQMDQNMIEKAVKYIICERVTDVFWFQFYSIVYTLILNKDITCEPKQELKLARHLCDKFVKNMGIRSGISYYEAVSETILDQTEKYTKYHNYYFKFFIQYANNLNQIYESKETIRLLERAEKRIPQFEISEEIQTSVMSKILNRKSVPLKDLGRIEEAKKMLDEALMLSQQLGEHHQTICNFHDIGNIYYTDNKNNEVLMLNWHNAFHTYQKYLSKNTDTKTHISSYTHEILADIMNFSYKNAWCHIKHLKKFINNTDMPFYEIKIRLIISLFQIAAQNAKTIGNELDTLLNEAEDLCVFHNYERDYYKCFYLQAVKYYKLHNYEKSLENYVLTYEKILKNCVDTAMKTRYEYFLSDLLIQIRYLGSISEVRKLAGSFNNISLKKTLMSSDEQFHKFYDTYQPDTPITDQNYHIGYPAV